MLLSDGFIDSVEKYPSRLALACQSKQVTYKQLLNNAVLFASKLVCVLGEKRAKGNQPVLIGILMDNCCEFIEYFFASSINGYTAVILDNKWTFKQIEEVTRCYKLDILIVDDENKASDFSTCGTIVLHMNYSITRNDSGPGVSREPVQEQEQKVPKGNPDLFIGFTSGTTSFPKGFVRQHKTWLESFQASEFEFGNCSEENILAPGPLCHGLTLYAAIEGLVKGASVFLLKKFEVADVIEILNENEITTFICVPTMLKKIVTSKNINCFPLVKKIITSGSKLEKTLINGIKDIFPNARLYEYYGASELGFVTIHDVFSSQPVDSVGRSFYGVEIEIRDNNGIAVNTGEVGTLWVRSNFIIDRYCAGADGAGFIRENGWATVEDQAYMDKQGNVYVISRCNRMIISGGMNIYPDEIELALNSLPEVSECCVLGLPDAYWGQIVCAAVKWHEQRCLSPGEISGRLFGKIPHYKFPRKVYNVNFFPKTRSGKIRIKEVQELIAQGSYSELK